MQLFASCFADSQLTHNDESHAIISLSYVEARYFQNVQVLTTLDCVDEGGYTTASPCFPDQIFDF